MADTESIRQIARSRAPLSTWLGIVLLFALFGVIVLAIIGPSPRGSDFEESRAKKRVENLKALREEADKTLTTYAWVDKNKGVARVPITRAMELTVAELAKQLRLAKLEEERREQERAKPIVLASASVTFEDRWPEKPGVMASSFDDRWAGVTGQ